MSSLDSKYERTPEQRRQAVMLQVADNHGGTEPLPEVESGQAAVGREGLHQPQRRGPIRPCRQVKEALQPAGQAGIAHGHAVEEAERAHHHVMRRPRSDAPPPDSNR